MIAAAGWLGPTLAISDAGGVSVIVLYCLAVYGAVGLVVALAFIAFGVTRLLPHPAPVSVGARILLIPGATVLWPYVMLRWIDAGRGQ